MVQSDMLTVDHTRRAAIAARRREFRALHERGCFVIPNPWDVGSARYLQHLGFKALATTSAGFAFSQGLPDSDQVVSRDRTLSPIGEIAAAVDLPVHADFPPGFPKGPSRVADNTTTRRASRAPANEPGPPRQREGAPAAEPSDTECRDVIHAEPDVARDEQVERLRMNRVDQSLDVIP